MDAESVRQVHEIAELIWNAQFAEAEKCLVPLLKKHPVFTLLYCEAATTKYLLSEQKEDAEIASARNAQSRKDCSALFQIRKPALKQYLAEYEKGPAARKPEEVTAETLPNIDCTKELLTASGINLKHVASALWSRAILAEICFMDTVIKFRELKYLKGVLDFKKSWDYFKECNDTFNVLFQHERALQEIPQLAHIRGVVDFGVGIFHFVCSVVPKHFQFLVEGIGFKADRALALDELKRSMRLDSIRSHFAALALAWIYGFFYYQYEVANQIIRLELDRFPSSPVILFTAGYIQRKQGNIEASSQYFLQAKDAIPDLAQFALKIDYERGSNHFLLLQWEPALELLSHFLALNKAEAFRAYCAYQVAFCRIMLDQKEGAVAAMKLIQPWVRKNFALDEYAGHQAKRYLKDQAFQEFEILYQQALIAHEACHFESVLELLDQAKPVEKILGDTLRALQLRGSAFCHLDDFEKAKACHKEVVSKEKDASKLGIHSYAIPFSFCGLAEISVVEKNAEASRSFLKKAKGFSNYEFEALLSWRMRKCEDDIRLLVVEPQQS